MKMKIYFSYVQLYKMSFILKKYICIYIYYYYILSSSYHYISRYIIYSYIWNVIYCSKHKCFNSSYKKNHTMKTDNTSNMIKDINEAG